MRGAYSSRSKLSGEPLDQPQKTVCWFPLHFHAQSYHSPKKRRKWKKVIFWDAEPEKNGFGRTPRMKREKRLKEYRLPKSLSCFISNIDQQVARCGLLQVALYLLTRQGPAFSGPYYLPGAKRHTSLKSRPPNKVEAMSCISKTAPLVKACAHSQAISPLSEMALATTPLCATR